MEKIFSIRSLVALKLYLWLYAKFSRTGNNEVLLTTSDRKVISRDYFMSTQQITNALKYLRDNGFLHGSDGTFCLDVSIIR